MTAAPWFDLSNLVFIGPGVGTAEALWGASIGLLCQALVRKGRGRPWVFGHLWGGLSAGLALVASGVLGALSGQPVALWASLVGLGAPLAVAAAGTLPSIGHAYRAVELRRMHALEL